MQASLPGGMRGGGRELAAVNTETLNKVLETDASIAQTFVTLNAGTMAELRGLIDSGNWSDYTRRVHGFKSGALWVGALHCGTTAYALEHLSNTMTSVTAGSEAAVGRKLLIQRLQVHLESDAEIAFRRLQRT